MQTINPKLAHKVVHGTPAERKYICERAFVYFALYYFSEFFTYKIAPFHYKMYDDLRRMLEGEFDYLVWVMFRESAKTSIAKIFATYCICYKKKHYINFDSYERSNAEQALFDIATWLQTNKKIIADFGQLYFEPPREHRRSTIKRIGNFITANGVKCEAFSTQQSTRGRIYLNKRPDLFVVDDFETAKTIESAAVTDKVTRHIDEMISGLAPGANVLFLGNYLTETGSMQYILDKAREDPRFRVHWVNVVDEHGEIAWKDKYAKTDKQAAIYNKYITDPAKKKVSLEAKRRTLNAGGRRVYEVEMMNDPAASGEMVFDRKRIDELLQQCEPHKEEVGGMRVWHSYNPKHRYAIGADIAEGIGRDSSASVVIDFSTNPAQQVASYASSRIAPDVFAHELKRQGDFYGRCLLAPEINNQGYATITELKRIYPVEHIYRRVRKDDAMGRVSRMLGWETNSATKTEIIYQLKSAIEDGKLKINDRRILEEARAYTQLALRASGNALSTRHFDLLMACAIAWEMRHYAELAQQDESIYYSKQKPYRGISRGENVARSTIEGEIML